MKLSLRIAAIWICALTLTTAPAFGTAKNVILFIGDGAGVSSLNAASIYGYGKPRALFIQKMPHLALSDTSSTMEWVTDAAASITAVATGVKGRNGVVSQSDSAERDVRDGSNLKTVLEYAEEHGLATGIVTNVERTGIADAPLSAFYAHANNRQRSGDMFLQLLNPRFGNGPDVVIGPGRKVIQEQVEKAGHQMESEIRAKGYSLVDSLAQLVKLDSRADRVIALGDETEFDLVEAVHQAVMRLSKNPNGFLLIVHSDCHLPNTRRDLERIVELDNTVRAVSKETSAADTLVLVTADHSFDLRIKGESLTETQKSTPRQWIAQVISMEPQHTADEVPVLASGPGSEQVQGYMSNTDVFHVMMDAFGWEHYRVHKRYAIEGTDSFDYITLDAERRRLYVSHGTKVEVLNADTGSPIGVIPDTPGVHGIAIVPALKRGFTTNGSEDKVSVFDTETLKVLQKIDVGKGPDGIFFDKASGRIFTNNHGSHDITAIDAAAAKVVGTIKLAGDGEQTVAGRDGLLWVNVEDTSEVVAYDSKTLEIKHRFPLGGSATPTGLAIDTETNRLFIGCRSKSLVVMDASTGKVITVLPIGSQVDAAGFDPVQRLIFLSNGDGTLNIFREKSANEYVDEGVVYTQPSAKTMVFDPQTKHIFLPGADVETIPAAKPGDRQQRKVWPGSFGILVVGKS